MLQGMGGWRGPLLFTDFCAAHLWLQDTRFANGICCVKKVGPFFERSRDQRARAPQNHVFLKETRVKMMEVYGQLIIIIEFNDYTYMVKLLVCSFKTFPKDICLKHNFELPVHYSSHSVCIHLETIDLYSMTPKGPHVDSYARAYQGAQKRQRTMCVFCCVDP